MDGQQGREEEGDSSCGAKREAAVLMERANSGAEARERAQGACWVMDGLGGKSWGSRTPRKCLGFSLG